MSETLSIPRDQFTKLLGTIKIIENCCTDCDIVGGKIRQKTNDRHFILDIDLTDILQTNDLSLQLIKQKVALLKSFELDDNVTVDDENVGIEYSDKEYTFFDPLSTVKIRIPLKKFLDNPFIEEEKFSQMLTISEENMIFEHTASAYMAKRIKGVCEGFGVESLKCSLENYDATLSTQAQNHELVFKEKKAITLNREMPKRFFQFMYLPFSFDISSDVSISAYQTSNDVLLCKFGLTYYGTPISIYTQVKLQTA